MDELLKWAPFASATAAAVAALLAYRQTRNALRVATLQALQEFFKTVIEREKALKSATSDDDKTYAFNEYMDCLELYAAACNRALFRHVANEIVQDKLIDVIVVLQNAPEWHSQISSAINSEIVYKHIHIFAKRHRRTIQCRSAAISSIKT